VVGVVVGLLAGIVLAKALVPDRPGHALDKIRPMMGITFIAVLVCTVAGCTIGALLAVSKSRHDPLPLDDE
jgi:hypothetical protein